MKVFLAGTTVCSVERGIYITELFNNKLHSYYHCNGGFETEWFMENKKNKVNLFLDSGAFSAFTQGIEIDIQAYIAFIKEHEQYLEVYANLDVIGDAEGTLKNQKIMEAAGLKPIPCFHAGEDFKYLKNYVDNYPYIAIGGVAQLRDKKKLIAFMDKCFAEYICRPDGLPKTKVHGFAVTGLDLMLRYPWFSVDSTSWVVTGRMGGVFVPKHRQGKYVYNENSWKVSVSTQSPNKSEAGEHIDTFSPAEQRVILDYFKAKGYVLGRSEFKTEAETYELADGERWVGKAAGGKREVEIVVEPGLSNDYMQRDELNIIYFLDLEKSMPAWPWVFKLHASKTGFGL